MLLAFPTAASSPRCAARLVRRRLRAVARRPAADAAVRRHRSTLDCDGCPPSAIRVADDETLARRPRRGHVSARRRPGRLRRSRPRPAAGGARARRSAARWRRCSGRASPARAARRPADRRGGRGLRRRRRRRRRCWRSLAFALDAVRRSCSACCARAWCAPARSPSCCAGWATRRTAARCATCSPTRWATARSSSSTGSTTRERWVDAEGRPPSCPTPTTRRAPGPASSARASASARSCTTARCCEDPELLALASPPPPASRSRTSACRRSCAPASRSCATSRARLVEAGMAERRRLERNLHDGAQQRLVALSLSCGSPRRKLRTDPQRRRGSCSRGAQEELGHALEELRELARGIHPAVLTDRGLEAALEALAGRSPVPVDARRHAARSGCPPPVEAAAYFVVAEALTNVAKYADATQARMSRRAPQRPRGRRGRRRRRRRRRPGAADRACAGWPTASRRSTDGWRSSSPRGAGTRAAC